MFITCYYNFSREPYFMREFCCGSIFFDSGRSKSGQQQKGLNYCKKKVMRFMIFFCY